MIPAGEGGGLDTTLRKFSTYLEKELGTSITITNRSGGSGVTGFTWSHNSTNDGYAYQFTAPSAIIAAAQADPKVRKFTEGMALVRTIVVMGRLVNLIVKPQ